MSTINSAKVSNLLVMVSNSYREVSKKGKVYYKLEFSTIASKTEDGDWTDVDQTSMVRISEDGYKAFSMRFKWTLNNILLLDVEEHIAGETEYVKDDEILVHLEDGLEVVSVVQANSLHLMKILPKVNMLDLKGELDKQIVLAVNRAAVLSAREIEPNVL